MTTSTPSASAAPLNDNNKAFTIQFDQNRQATAINVPLYRYDPSQFLTQLNLAVPKTAILLSGGADNMEPILFTHLEQLFARGVSRAAERMGAVFISGGTDSGVMRLLGNSIAAHNYQTPLIGVLPKACCTYPNQPEKPSAQAEKVNLEPHHTHFLLVNAQQWGEETGVMYGLAEELAKTHQVPLVTLLINGGNLSKMEILRSVRLGIPIIVVEGTGRLADELADLSRHPPNFIEDAVLAEIIADGHLHIFSVTSSVDELERLIYRQLRGDSTLNIAWQQFAVYDFNAKRHQKLFRRLQLLIIVLGVVGTFLALFQSTLKSELNFLRVEQRLTKEDNSSITQTLKEMYLREQQTALRKANGLAPNVQVLVPQAVTDWQPTFWDYLKCVGNKICLMEIVIKSLSFVILLIPVIISLLLAAATRFNSGNKWLMLRASAEAVKREIFTYRTLAGTYSTYQLEETMTRESLLAKKLQIISHQLMQTDVTNSALLSYKGHLPPPYTTSAQDDGMSVLTPEQYMSYRLEDQLFYYLSKTHKTAKISHLLHWTVLIVGALGTLLAALSMELWIALTTALVAAISSYMEQHQMEASLRKYNQAAADLINLRNWWVALSAREQADQANIDKLVTESERVLQAEFSGWMEEMKDTISKLKEEQEKKLEEIREKRRIEQAQKTEDANTRLKALKAAGKNADKTATDGEMNLDQIK